VPGVACNLRPTVIIASEAPISLTGAQVENVVPTPCDVSGRAD